MLERRMISGAILFLLVFLVPAPPATGQDLRYSRTTRMEFGGTVGRLLSAMPGGGGPSVETTLLKGNRIRRDQAEESSTIVDWGSGLLTVLDHGAHTFAQVDLVEAAQAAAALAESIDGALATEDGSDGRLTELADAVAEGAQTAAEEAEAAYREGGGDQLGLEVSLQSARTGRTEEIQGYQAEQILLTFEIKGEKDRADWEAEDTRGGLAIVTEVWLSRDFPEYEAMQQMQGEALDRLKEEGTDKGLLGALESLLAYDPRVKFAFEKNRETLDAMDGVPLRHTMHFVNLPGEARLDRDQVLAEQDRSLADEGMDAAAQEVKETARSAVRGLSGRLLGRKKAPEPEPEPVAEVPPQQVFLRIVSEIAEVDTGLLPGSLFEPPPDYAPVTTETAGSGDARR